MNTMFLIQSTVEVILSVFFIWGLFNESKLAVAEKKLFKRIFGSKKAHICKIENLQR